MLFDIGDTSVYGGDVGFARFVGNGLDEIGFDLLDYNNGDPLYQISLSNGTNNVSWGLSSISGAVSLSALDVNFGSVETFFGNSLGSNEANISADANTATASILGQDADSGAVIFAQADKAGIIYNTISSDLDGAGTPLVMAVFDENERGGGYSARGRNPNYPVAGADMYVWDPALGGDRTYLYLTEESINTSLMLDPVIVGARNNTINDIDEISFEFHNGDPTIANNSVYKINADFTWSKPATLGDIMTLNGATGALSVSGNTASSYAATFFNDGNNTNRYGVKIQAGADNCSSTGTCDFIDFFDGDGTAAGGVRIVNGTVGTYNPSDMRLKTNIQNTSLAGLSTINALRVTDFQRTSGGILGPIQTGFIAQEVQQVYPAMVAATPDGYLAISEGMLIPVLVKAVQELDVKMKRVETAAALMNNGIFDRIKTKELCVEDVCVTRDQFLRMVQNLGSGTASPTETPTVSFDPSEDQGGSQDETQETVGSTDQEGVSNPGEAEQAVESLEGQPTEQDVSLVEETPV
jgi:hypothetical protein